jgi:hypothetical protein
MKKTMISLALLVLVGVPGALAQSGNTPSSSGMKGTVLPAPVGHRQPRAGDIPDEKNLSNPDDPNDPLSKENKLLDKKIKSICRGC